MSRATREAIVILSSVAGALICIQDMEMEEAPLKALKESLAITKHAISEYPDTGSPYKNFIWSRKAIRSIDEDIVQYSNIYTYRTMVWFCHLLILDLLDKVRDPIKIRHITPILDSLTKATDDIYGEEVPGEEYELAKTLANKLQENMRSM